MKSMITAKERKLLVQYKREWDELGRYLHSATVDAETASPEVWRRYFEGCLKLSATPYPGMELAAHILARDYLMKKHGVKTFDLSGRFKPKSNNIGCRDRCGIKAQSASGEKIAAIILSGDGGFDDAIIAEMLDEELWGAKASLYYVFFATMKGYTWAVRQYRKRYPACKFVFLDPPKA